MDILEQVQIGNKVFSVAPESLTLMDVAKLEGLSMVRVLGKGGMIEKPIIHNGWEIVPARLFERNIPQEAVKIIKTLERYDSMIEPRIVGFLVADDLRNKDKEKPTVNWEEIREKIKEPIKKVDWKGKWDQATEPVRKVDWQQVGKTTGKVALYGLGAVGAVAAAVAILAAAMVALVPIAVVGALAYDPVLIAVTEDGEWVALYEWWD